MDKSAETLENKGNLSFMFYAKHYREYKEKKIGI